MANPIQVQKYLRNLDYPAEKDTIISHAKDEGAPEEIVIELELIDDREYEGPSEVSEELGRKTSSDQEEEDEEEEKENEEEQ